MTRHRCTQCGEVVAEKDAGLLKMGCTYHAVRHCGEGVVALGSRTTVEYCGPVVVEQVSEHHACIEALVGEVI